MKRYLVFGMAAMVLLLFAIDATAMSVALPVLTSSFGASLILAAWVLSGYQLAIIVALPLAGKLSDTFGRKSTFVMFLSIFTVSSFLCSIAPNIEWLIAFRVIQGLGGSGFMPSASGIIAHEFPHSRQQALGLLTSIVPIGQIVGPNLGGWMISTFSWRSIFWINIPLGIIVFTASLVLLADSKKEDTAFDWVGTGLMVGTLGSFFMALSFLGGDAGISRAVVSALFLVSAACLILFIRRENRVPYPLIDLAVMRETPFIAANIYNLIFGFTFGALSLIPLYVVSIYGMSTMESGLILTPRSVCMLIMVTITSLSLVKWGYRWPMLIGTSLMLPCFILLVLEPAGLNFLTLHFGSTAFMLITMGIVGCGMGMTAPASNNACIELMPNRVSTIVGLRVMFRQIGSVFSIGIGSLALHALGMAHGFQVFFLGLAAAMAAVMIPCIFFMPKSCKAIANK